MGYGYKTRRSGLLPAPCAGSRDTGPVVLKRCVECKIFTVVIYHRIIKSILIGAVYQDIEHAADTLPDGDYGMAGQLHALEGGSEIYPDIIQGIFICKIAYDLQGREYLVVHSVGCLLEQPTIFRCHRTTFLRENLRRLRVRIVKIPHLLARIRDNELSGVARITVRKDHNLVLALCIIRGTFPCRGIVILGGTYSCRQDKIHSWHYGIAIDNRLERIYCTNVHIASIFID